MDSFGHTIAVLLSALVLAAAPDPPTAAGTDLVGTDVSFTASDGSTLFGTVVALAGDSPPGPAMVLVHGGGAGPREWLRQEAEAFARAGIITLIYDKRTKGYSLTQRSYGLLAEDALAAVRLLRAWPGVDPARVGLWGVSEGGWVAPLAAAASQEIAFVITVGAGGLPPARQEGWSKANRLRAAGVAAAVPSIQPS